jgi:N-acetylmuramoyl-L-alanine amidase
VCGEDFNNLTEFEVNQGVATKVMENLIDAGFDVELLKEFDPRLVGFKALALVSIHADSCNYINDLATGYKLAATVNNPRPEKTARLLACIRDRYAEATGMEYHANSVTNDMSSYHAFNEIHSDTPAVIIEVGFMNLDYQILSQGQDQIAAGISDGLMCYVHNENVSEEGTQ